MQTLNYSLILSYATVPSIFKKSSLQLDQLGKDVLQLLQISKVLKPTESFIPYTCITKSTEFY